MNSPLAYAGGKSKLAATIIKLIPDHSTYCEAFTGAGWVFFNKEPSKYEILNDKDSELITFYRVLQNHLEEFLKQFKWMLSSREWFDDWKSQLKGRGLTDIQRAARYYYLQRLAFGGRVKGRSFGSAPGRLPRINLIRLEEELSAVHLRLVQVTIENLDWQDFLKRYDRPQTFFYLDPPFLEKPCYQYNFSLRDFKELAITLGDLQGHFILSLNQHPDLEKTFRNFFQKPVMVKYTIGRSNTYKGRELILSNFNIEGGSSAT